MRSRATMVLALVVALVLPAMAAGAAPKEKPDKAKVELCHVPPGNPGEAHTISVGGNAAAAHLAHGDTEGACAVERPGRVDDDDDSDDDTSDNRSPIARAGDDRCVVYGPSYELDGSSSSDPDGDDLTFDWDVASTPSGSTLDDGDLSPDDNDTTPTFTPDRLGTYDFDLEVTDPDGASDDDSVAVTAHIDVELTDGPFEVDEGETTPVTVFFTELAPQDVTVQLVLETNVAVVVPEADDDADDAITSIVIEEGDSRATVYLFGIVDGDGNDDSTVLNAVVGSTSCGDTAFEDVEVEDDDVDLRIGSEFLRFFVIRQHLEPWIV